jgi:PAS domain S-box-containing protein
MQGPRHCDNTMVTGAPRIRFYAGAALVTSEGHALGTVCVIDTKPRPEGLTKAQLDGLVALARQGVNIIEMLAIVQNAKAERQRSLDAQAAGQIGTFEVTVATDMVEVSAEFCRLFGIAEAPSYPISLLESLVLPEAGAVAFVLANRHSGAAPLHVEYRIRRPQDGEIRWIERRARFERSDGKAVRMFGTVRDVTERNLASKRMRAMLALGDELRGVDSSSGAVAIAAPILAEALEADRVGYIVVESVTGDYCIEADHCSNGMISIVGRHPARNFEQSLGRLADGQVTSVDVMCAAPLRDSEIALLNRLGVLAMINVPLVVRGVVVGVLFVHSRRARRWASGETELARATADRVYACIA